MELHHKIKPHHHVTIWSVAVLAVIMAASFYTNEVIVTQAETGEPSERTKQFFGEDGSGRGERTDPPECQRNETQENDMKGKIDEHNQLRIQIDSLAQQLNSSATPDEQKGELSSQLSLLQQKEKELLASIQSAGGVQQDSGPNEACMKAIIAREKNQMSAFRGKIDNNILPTLVKVEGVVAKIEAKIPSLKEAGVDPAKIAKIESDINTIKAQIATMRSFFQEMKDTLSSFLANADSDPKAAFEVMKNKFGNGGNHTKAGNAADTLVSTFEDLEKVISEIK